MTAETLTLCAFSYEPVWPEEDCFAPIPVIHPKLLYPPKQTLPIILHGCSIVAMNSAELGRFADRTAMMKTPTRVMAPPTSMRGVNGSVRAVHHPSVILAG